MIGNGKWVLEWKNGKWGCDLKFMDNEFGSWLSHVISENSIKHTILHFPFLF